MKDKYDIIFLTNLPSFYKINLYNEIAKNRRVLVLLTGHANSGRNRDFFAGEIEFDYHVIAGKSHFVTAYNGLKVLSHLQYDNIVVSGWDHLLMWGAAFLSPKKKNSVVVESSCHESKTVGIKGALKRIFIKRFDRAFVSGKAQKAIFDSLGYRGECIVTKGVGVFNYLPQAPYEPRVVVKKFVYVGRFVDVKNLEMLIGVFNGLSDLELHMVGFGILEDKLKSIAGSNIIFHGAVDNSRLPEFYRSMDAFVLPSKSEAWGLVVEEALNNGLPVIVSDRVGCADEIINETNGLIFKYDSAEDLRNCILKMLEVKFHNNLRKSISELDFDKIEREQVQKYLL